MDGADTGNAELFEGVFDRGMYGIVVIDGAGVVHTLNPAAERCGRGLFVSICRASELVAQNRISGLLEQARFQARAMERANEQLDQRAQELQAQQEELEANNELLAEQKSRLELVNEELRRSRCEISEKAEALERISRNKSEFLANMSHELRTPLNSILILAKVLRESRPENLRPTQMESLGIIASSGTDLLNLVNDIQDSSKIEAGKFTLRPERVDITTLVRNLEPQFHALMAEKGLHFHVEVEEGVPASLRTDRLRLEQVLRNLLSNAHHFTERGEVVMRVCVAEKDPNGAAASLAFEVADTGVGIPRAKHPLVFQPYQQLDPELSRRFGGTGLGLSICASLAQGLGGVMEFESDEAEGSIFRLILPLAARGTSLSAYANGPG